MAIEILTDLVIDGNNAHLTLDSGYVTEIQNNYNSGGEWYPDSSKADNFISGSSWDNNGLYSKKNWGTIVNNPSYTAHSLNNTSLYYGNNNDTLSVNWLSQGGSFTVQYNYDSYCCLPVFAIDTTNQTGRCFLCWGRIRSGSNRGCTISPIGTATAEKYTVLTGALPVEYTWQSVASISGRNGILSLSVIKDSLLGDLTGGTWQSVDEVMDVLSPNSRLYKYWNNLAVGQEVTICYSGQINYLNIKRDTASSCQLKFYRDSSHFLIYSTSVNMQTLGRDPYLCFVIEEEQNLVQPIIAYVLDVQGQQQLTWSKISPAISDSEMYALYVWLQFTEDTTPNPYSQGSESNGGEDFNLTPQDDFSDELPPDITGLDCGFFTVYCPTSSQLQDLSSFLWSDDIIDNIKKYFGNVSDSIISLYMLPYKPSGLSSKKFQVGNIVLDDGPSVEYLTGQRYVDVDMGSFSIEPTFNSYLDYEPFTKLSIYLPFIGVQQLPTDEFMTKADPSGALSDQSGSTITVQYRIDLLTGGCVAYIKQGTQNKLQFSGKCGATLPISGANYNNMISGLVQAVGGLASTIASGGLTAPMSFGAAISGTVSAMKPDLYKAGNLSGELSLLSYNRPMIIKTRPNIHKDMADQINVDGLPSYKVKTIGDYTGYVSCVAVHVDGITCTDAEKEKIHSLLLEGVIV